jgi:hypothetical protein
VPGYNKDKVLRILRRRDQHAIMRREAQNRHREAVERLNHWKAAIRTAAYGRGRGAADEIEALLALPVAEALEKDREEIAHLVNGASWQEYLLARRRYENLTRELAHATAEAEQFTFVHDLLLKIRELGFRDPELEM